MSSELWGGKAAPAWKEPFGARSRRGTARFRPPSWRHPLGAMAGESEKHLVEAGLAQTELGNADTGPRKLADHISGAAGVARRGRQRRGIVVEEEELWRDHDAGADVEAPPHAAGVFAHQLVGGRRQPEGVEELLGPLRGAAAAEAEQLGQKHEVLAAGELLVD